MLLRANAKCRCNAVFFRENAKVCKQMQSFLGKAKVAKIGNILILKCKSPNINIMNITLFEIVLIFGKTTLLLMWYCLTFFAPYLEFWGHFCINFGDIFALIISESGVYAA